MKRTPARRPVRAPKSPRMKMIKEVVIKEPYVAITGNFRRALILGQFIYWTKINYSADILLEEDNARRIQHGQKEIPYRDGWIYKTAKELLTELMLDCSEETLRREMKFLVDCGLLQKRRNPEWIMDATLQYRVEFLLLSRKLKEKGYPLDGYYFAELGSHPDIESTIPLSVESIPQRVECSPLSVEALPESTISENTCTKNTSCRSTCTEELVYANTEELMEPVMKHVYGNPLKEDPCEGMDEDQESL